MTWLAEYSTHRSSSRGLAPGFRKKKVASSAPVLELGGGRPDHSLIYVKPYAERALKVFILV